MIRVNGRIYSRFRLHPIYVNDKRVKEVWVNDNMVYPEGGDYMKVKYSITATYSHSHNMDELIPSAAGYKGYIYPCSASFTFKAVAIRTFHMPSDTAPVIKKENIEEPYGSAVSTEAHIKNLGLSGTPQPCSPLYDMDNIPSIYLSNRLMENYKFKFNLSSIPICGPYELPPWSQWIQLYTSETGSGTEEIRVGSTVEPLYTTLRITPDVNSIVGMGEYNDIIFGNMEGCESPFGKKFELGDWFNYLRFDNNGYRYPIDVTRLHKLPSGEMEETELGTYYYPARFRLYLPLTEILYYGDERDAPAEMLTISDDELIYE